MNILGIVGILLGIAILMYFTFQKLDVVWLSVIAAMVVAICNRALSLETYTETFMSGAAGFIKTYTPIFLVGCMFAALYSESGASQVIAKTIIRTFAKGRRTRYARNLGCGVVILCNHDRFLSGWN